MKMFGRSAGARLLAGALACCASLAWSQSYPDDLAKRMDPPLQTPEEVALRLRHYLMERIPTLPPAKSAAAWAKESAELRSRALDTLYRGWPKEWIEGPLKFEDLGILGSGQGYRMRRIRYQIVPGMMTSAIVYEPDSPKSSKMPAVLNVNGHVGPPGKSVEYKQKRCINQARMGIVALNPDWFGFGDTEHPENGHFFAAHLDLVGANGAGLFYLALRRGLDYLAQRNDVDSNRLGVTGLSGGGWQTIFISALDPRVAVSVPVAGFMSLASRIQKFGEPGDIEQNPTDVLKITDYPHLVALRAPRPTLLVYNAEDNCCFRAPLVKERIYDQVRPFFFDQVSGFAWHENLDPADHNYQLDNRIQAYRFFARHFNLPGLKEESLAGQELKTREELAVPLPPDNLTLVGLARQFAAQADRSAKPDREQLRDTLRYRQVEVAQAWPLANTKHKEVETISYLFEFSDGLSATAVWAKNIAAPENAPMTFILDDQGKKKAAELLTDRMEREEQVFVVDLLFHGDATAGRDWTFTEFLSSVGERPLGIEAAQLLAIRRWSARRPGGANARIFTRGFSSQTVAQAATALEPNAFRTLNIIGGQASLAFLLKGPVKYQEAPDLFCFDLYRRFDFDQMTALAAPTRVVYGAK